MFIHLYSDFAWGATDTKISDKDIEITKNELDDIEKKQKDGFYYAIKNKDATNIIDLFEIIEIIKPVKAPTLQERLEVLETMILEGL